MNSKEYALKTISDQYARNLAEYSRTLVIVLDGVNKLEQLEDFMKANLEALKEHEGNVRALKFVQDSKLILDQSQIIADLIKSKIK